MNTAINENISRAHYCKIVIANPFKQKTNWDRRFYNVSKEKKEVKYGANFSDFRIRIFEIKYLTKKWKELAIETAQMSYLAT